MRASIFLGILTLICGISAQSSSEHCQCTDFERRTCGSDGKQYLNRCELECAQFKHPEQTIHEVACAPVAIPSKNREIKTCQCPRILKETCGSDGISYGNPCQFQCAQKQVPGLKQIACPSNSGGRRAGPGPPRSNRRKLQGNFQIRTTGRVSAPYPEIVAHARAHAHSHAHRRPHLHGHTHLRHRHRHFSDSHDTSSSEEPESDSEELQGRRGFNRKHSAVSRKNRKLTRGDNPHMYEDEDDAVNALLVGVVGPPEKHLMNPHPAPPPPPAHANPAPTPSFPPAGTNVSDPSKIPPPLHPNQH